MWVFAYGSLMYDRWHVKCDCVRCTPAELPNYKRTFNKLSIRNWGTKGAPCPTLNLKKETSGSCWGMAFEFPDGCQKEIFAFLNKREGRGFVFPKLSVRLSYAEQVNAVVPIYQGKNVIHGNNIEKTAAMVLAAEGCKGSCVAYVKKLVAKLSDLGIDDPIVTELEEAVRVVNDQLR
jgi:cation transport protein ChaC